MDMLDSRVLSFFVLMHVLRASLLTSLSSHSSSLSIYTLCFFLNLLWFFCTGTAVSFSTYLSFPPIGLNSSSTLCFYMKPEHH